MISQKLYEFLFNSSNQLEELKNQELHEQLVHQLNSYVKPVLCTHKVWLQHPGVVPDRLYFVESGVVRGYTLDDDKLTEKTESFWLSGSLVVDINSFLYQLESKIFIEAFPDTELLFISRSHVEEIILSFPFTQAFISSLIQNEVEYSNKNLLSINDAWKRLVKMRNTFPGLELLVSKEDVASFLNISPQHLSRIIRNHRKK